MMSNWFMRLCTILRMNLQLRIIDIAVSHLHSLKNITGYLHLLKNITGFITYWTLHTGFVLRAVHVIYPGLILCSSFFHLLKGKIKKAGTYIYSYQIFISHF